MTKNLTRELLRERALRAFAAGWVWVAGDTLRPRTEAIGEQRKKSLRRLLHEIDRDPTREFSPEEIMRLAYDACETYEFVEEAIRARPLRLGVCPNEKMVSLSRLARMCGMSERKVPWLENFVRERFPNYGQEATWGKGMAKQTALLFTPEEALEIERAVRACCQRGE